MRFSDLKIDRLTMSSYLTGGGRSTAAATYGFDLEIELFKSASASVRASPHSSSSSSSSSLSSCFTSSSPNSTISESSNNSHSPPLSICTRKPRTPRKRPNQTYNEAAALLSTAYPNIFSPKQLANPPSFKFAKSVDSTSWLNSAMGEELLLPEKPLEPRLGLVSTSSCSNYSDCSSEKRCESPMEEDVFREDHDFDTESILDEEIEGGIDSIMGNLTVKNENGDHNQYQQTNNYSYGFPLGLGLGLPGGRFDFGFGMTKGVRAFRNSPGGGYGGSGEWWNPTLTTVEVGVISPRLEKKSAVEKKKSICSITISSSKKKKLPESSEKVREVASGTVPLPPPKEEIPAASSSDHRIQLKLNYDDVLSAWSDRGSPFSDDSPASELSGSDALARLAQIDLFGENGGVREASVQRYKEKRRTRLFSKKIRYQVRKVNADQRPRMKGRFVRSPDSSGGGGQA